MLLLEYKIRRFLEDNRNDKEKLLEEFKELNKIDTVLRLAGCFSVNVHKKWIHRAKHRIQKNKFLGVCQVSWEKIQIGKR